jgi:crotonobetainyl-CoA:carnitine CoA-transferase CaiB-like acyl-CoA transferase
VSKNRVDDIVKALVAESIPVAPVLQVDQTLEDPHVKARGIIWEAEHPTAGTVRAPGFPVKMSETPGSYRLPAPRLGEHNEEILTQLLGYSKEQVEDLRKAGIFG